MADVPEHARKMLDELLVDIRKLLDEADQALGLVNMIASKYDLPEMTLTDVWKSMNRGDDVGLTAKLDRGGPSGSRGGLSIRHDQFLGAPPLEAAKAYLAQVGQAASLDDIADAIEKGGAAVKGAQWRDQLETSLIRSTLDIVKVREHVFGLSKFYSDEQIKALRATRRQQASKPPSKMRSHGSNVRRRLGAKVKRPRPLGSMRESSDKEPPRSALTANGHDAEFDA